MTDAVGAHTWIPILRRRGVPVLFYSFINQGYRTDYYRELLGVSHGCEFHRYLDGWVVIEAADSGQFTGEFLPRLKQPAYVDFFLRQCAHVSADVLTVGATIKTHDHDQDDVASLLFDFMQFSSASVRVMPFLNTMVFVQEAIEGQLREALARNLGVDDDDPNLPGQMQTLMLGGADVPFATRSIADLAQLATDVAKSFPSLANDLRSDPLAVTQQHIEGYSEDLWLRLVAFLGSYDFLETDYYIGEPTTLTRLLEQLGVFLGRQLEEGGDGPTLERQELPDLNDQVQHLIRTAQTMQYLREYRLEALFKAGRDCRGLLTTIGETLGLGYDELLFMTFDEIQRSLSAEAVSVDLGLIAERMVGYASSVEDGVPAIVVGKDLASLRATLPAAASSNDTLVGVTAFSGTCSGRVRIIDELSKVATLAVGEILVTPMTLPYHVPAMARAAAVLTDEGGILSHAAIVCRELRVPCIVGLGNATSSLSDGEVVRVAAKPSGGVVERGASS